ncbi:hypothetical protein C8F04DRAFT_1276836 [Mycena alexandri]|uniref:Uncharacterized protein n=1 Tax=Mycena alexandri TaxID=1745969 RepID=A0AAD6S125_9AGAR|nr:hypothetical protein C8F04DRAFT_1276836 [Mycena alexandri]
MKDGKTDQMDNSSNGGDGIPVESVHKCGSFVPDGLKVTGIFRSKVNNLGFRKVQTITLIVEDVFLATFNILVPDDEVDGPGQSIISGAPPSSASTIFVVPDWGTLPTWHISVFFDPHLIRSAVYGLLSVSIDTQHLLVPKDANHDRTLTLPYDAYYGSNIQIGTYIYAPGLRMVPTIAITVGLPAESGLSIPR